MKAFLFVIVAIFGMVGFTMAQKGETVTVRYGQQKRSSDTGVMVKFVAVKEDSRCPVGVDCIWAGNAKIEVKVSNEQGSKILTMNTTAGPKGDQFGGWAIRLVSLSPEKPSKGKLAANKYTAVFSFERLSR